MTCDCWLCREFPIHYNVETDHTNNTIHYGLEADLIAEELGLPLIYQDQDNFIHSSGSEDSSF